MATDSKKVDEKDKGEAKRGLEVYECLPPSKKGAFIDRWKASKDNKNMAWLKDFEETLSKEKEFKRKNLSGLYTRHLFVQICMHLCIESVPSGS